MSKVLALSEQSIRKVLDMKSVLSGVEEVYRAKAKGTGVVWDMVFYEFEPGKADMDIKSGYLKDSETYGLKLVSWYGENSGKGLPALYGTTLLFDGKTGAPTALLNAEYITGMRTGAAGAIGAKYLARPESTTLFLLGTGHQAEFQALATLHVMKQINRVLLWDPLEQERAKVVAERLQHKLGIGFQTEENREIRFETATDFESGIRESDIVITITPSRKPLIKKEWVKPGTHFSCVGADMAGKQEIEEEIFRDATVFVDDIDQAVRVGEVEIPIKKEVIGRAQLKEIGSLILGEVPGRRHADEITIFDTTGIALQDIMISNIALRKAKERGIGTEVEI